MISAWASPFKGTCTGLSQDLGNVVGLYMKLVDTVQATVNDHGNL